MWKSTVILGTNIGFRLLHIDEIDHNKLKDGTVGSISFINSQFRGVKQAIIIADPSNKPETNTTGIVLDNVLLEEPIIGYSNGKEYLKPGYYKQWTLGTVYQDGKREWTYGNLFEYARQDDLLGEAREDLEIRPYFERAKPQYEDWNAKDFVHLKSEGAKGDWLSSGPRHGEQLR